MRTRTMKKQYMTPLVAWFTIKTQQHLMEGSVTETLKSEVVDDTTEGFVQYGHSSSIWDDEEE